MVGSTLHAHCFQLFVIAGEARERAIVSMQRGSNVASSDALVAVVFAAFAAEAFINELGTILERESIAGYPKPDRRWGAAAAAISALEADRKKPYDKFIAAHHALSGTYIDAGREPYQSFGLLMTLRDWIGHTKPDRNPSDGRTLPTELQPLRSAGLTYPRPRGVGGSWLDSLLTDRIADWACHVSLKMIRYTLDLEPETGYGVNFVDLFLREKVGSPSDELLSRGAPSDPRRPT